MSSPHPTRFGAPLDLLGEILRAPDAQRRWSLVRGEVLALTPPRSRAVTLPFDLERQLGESERLVLARVDIEEHRQPVRLWQRATVERGRDFYFADESGRGLVRLVDDESRLHPDVELRLDKRFVELPAPGRPELSCFVRTLTVGEPVYVLGRARTELDPAGGGALAGYRDAPTVVTFDGERGPLMLYDERAYRQVAAWYALPWYRKLSLLVRNR